LRERGIPLKRETKDWMIATLLVWEKRQEAEALKKKEREADPIVYAKWWRASIIVCLLKREARRIHYGEEETAEKTPNN